jgi:hypothetical protein
MLSRFPMWKQFFVEKCYEAAESEKSRIAVLKAVKFLKSDYWRGLRS